MTEFLGQLIITPHFELKKWDGKNWDLCKDFLVQDDILGLVRIPMDFTTDGGTIPWAAQNIVKPLGTGLFGFVAHDWAYGTQTMSKDEADKFLFRCLRACGFNEVSDGVIYEALQMFGDAAWESDKANIAANLKLLEAV